ncbi:MAG TPA: PorV/PorQ family protein [Ignavibacteriaceae bacterium]|nr:PorV/PorQ family protein [Ignavibacteriaceae bacterium]
MSFLKFGFGARNIALGDAGSAFSNDVTALFYNPAKLAGKNNSELMLMHNSWIQDIRSEVIGAKTSFWGLPVAVGFIVTSINDIEVRNRVGDPEATFNANYFSGSIATGFKLNSSFDVGFSVKYLYENIFVDESNGFGIDLGVVYKSPVKDLNISVAVRNIGSMNSLRSTATKLPTELRIGTSYLYSITDSKINLTGGLEYLSYLRENENHINIGLEATYNNSFSLRGGYQSGYESKGITAGVGIKWGNLFIDYAYVPFKLGLGNASLFSIQFDFN